MKIVKIILAVVVIAIIGFFIWKWLVVINPPKEITPPINPFTAIIQSKIDSIKQMPANVFCQKFYNDIQYLIDDYHQKGFMGKSENDNNQWQEILSKNLYSAYAPKFIEQAMFVFSGSDWEYNDLKFIRSEVNTLNSSPFLDSSGPVADSFRSISAILAKHDEITNFISSCNGFSYYNYDLDKSFPDVRENIQKSRAYLANNQDNQYTNNCTRLREGLKEIPNKLFGKHISYLTRKINRHGGRYNEFNYQSDYSRVIYTPLKTQIEDLNKETYDISNNAFDVGYNSLDNSLSNYNRKATDYFFRIMEKYDEIKKFISSCNKISPSNYKLNSSSTYVSEMIQKSQEYLTKNLDNTYLKIVLDNNPQMKESLKEVPKILFDKYFVFIQREINNNGGRFTEYKNKSDYLRTIYNPLRNQVEVLDKIYVPNKSVFKNKISDLDKLLKKFRNDANNYYINPKKWKKLKKKEK